jgi:hypothetical protein
MRRLFAKQGADCRPHAADPSPFLDFLLFSFGNQKLGPPTKQAEHARAMAPTEWQKYLLSLCHYYSSVYDRTDKYILHCYALL